MQENLDISKILSLLTEHPEIISQVSALMKNKEDEVKSDTPEESVSEVVTDTVETSAKVEENSTRGDTSERRVKLLSAMKPYLSKERSSAIDSMIAVSEVLDSMKRR